MQIETTTRHHLTPVKMAIIKNLQIINAGEGVERSEPSCTVGGNVKWYSHYEQYGGSLKKLKIELPYDHAIPLLGLYPETKHGPKGPMTSPQCSLQWYLQWPRYRTT